jgi:hypothetical protein
MRRMPRLQLVLLALNGLFLGLAIWGAEGGTPGVGGIGAGLAAMAAILTGVPLAIGILLALVGLPRVATAPPLLPFLVVAGYQYLRSRSARRPPHVVPALHRGSGDQDTARLR